MGGIKNSNTTQLFCNSLEFSASLSIFSRGILCPDPYPALLHISHIETVQHGSKSTMVLIESDVKVHTGVLAGIRTTLLGATI